MRPKHKRQRFSDAEVARALRAAARAPKRDKATAKGYSLFVKEYLRGPEVRVRARGRVRGRG